MRGERKPGAVQRVAPSLFPQMSGRRCAQKFASFVTMLSFPIHPSLFPHASKPSGKKPYMLSINAIAALFAVALRQIGVFVHPWRVTQPSEPDNAP